VKKTFALLCCSNEKTRNCAHQNYTQLKYGINRQMNTTYISRQCRISEALEENTYMVTYQLKNNPKVIHRSYVSKNSVPKVYHRKIMFKTFEVYPKPFHSHDWQRRSRSLPCHFPSQKFRRKLKFNPTHLPTKISGKPHSPG